MIAVHTHMESNQSIPEYRKHLVRDTLVSLEQLHATSQVTSILKIFLPNKYSNKNMSPQT